MRHSIIIISFFVFSLGFFIGSPVRNAGIDFTKEWKIVDSLEQIGLFSQALKKVDLIYGEARKEHQSGDELKALIFKLRFIHVLSEDGYIRVLEELSEETDDNRAIFRAIKASMLAEIYTRYYQMNRWNIFNNTGYASPGIDYIKSWSPAQFGSRIDSLYQESLSDYNILTGVDLADYQSILKDSLPAWNKLTLHDLLSGRALDFYSLSELDYSSDPLPEFLLDTMLFSPVKEFISWMSKENRGDSFFSRSLKIIGSQLENHIEELEGADLLRIDLLRLKYAYRVYLGAGEDAKYLGALDYLLNQADDDSLKAEINFERAEFYSMRSNKYQLDSKDNVKYVDDLKQAYYYAQKALDTSPLSNAGIRSQNLINRIVNPQLKLVLQSVVFPNRHIPISVEYKNLTGLWYWITPVSPLKTLSLNSGTGRKDHDVFVEGNNPVASGKFNLPDRGDFNFHRAIADLPPLPEGNYQLLISSSPNLESEKDIFSRSVLRASNLAWLTQLKDGDLKINIIDRGSGNPQWGIKVKQYFRRYDSRMREEELVPGRIFESNRKGEVIIPAEANKSHNIRSAPFLLLIGSDDDGIIMPDRFYQNQIRYDQNLRPSQKIFTDRGIYRPGQLVQFAGLLVLENENKLQADKERKLEVFFQDANHKTLDTLKVQTDDYGFFKGFFRVPDQVMSGRFQIITTWGRQIVQVEEYKRPGFIINIDKDPRVYNPGDSIYISGVAEAFAGMKLQNAVLHIDAYLNLYGGHPYKIQYTGRRILIGSTEGYLNPDGTFSWSIGSWSFTDNTFSRAIYEFVVKVKDLNGETREKTQRIVVDKNAVFAKVNGPNKIDRRSAAKWEVFTNSPDGRSLETPVLIKIARLNDPDRRELPFPLPKPDTWILNGREWERRFPRIPYRSVNKEDSVRSVFTSEIYKIDKGHMELVPDVSKWGIGRYRIIVSLPDAPDQIIGQHDFDIYDSKRRDFPVRDPLWIDHDNFEYQPGDKMKIFLGSRYQGLYLFEVSGIDTIFYSEWISLGNIRSKRVLPITEDMCGNINIRLTGVYENNHFSSDKLVVIPRKEGEFEIVGLDSLDLLVPGMNAELHFSVYDSDGNPASIKGVFTIYDASLDEISPLRWSVFRWPQLKSGKYPWRSGGFGTSFSRIIQSPQVKYQAVSIIADPSINWFGLSYYGIRDFGSREMVMEPAAARLKTSGISDEEAIEDQGSLAAEDTELADSESGININGEQLKQSTPPYIRKDFRETAYFNSSFESGEDGKAMINFIVPDAITKWNIKVYGHNGELVQILQESEVQSRKDLMLLPNLPRFVREGDHADLAIKIIYNGNSSTQVKTSVRIENPLDQNKIIFNQNKELSLNPGDQKVINWKVKVPEGVQYLKFYFDCSDEALSDALTEGIPVLPRELSFWESKNFFLGEHSGVNVAPEHGAEKAVLELNTQPMWLAVQALPVIADRDIACSEYWFSRYLIANLIRNVSKLNPEIPGRLKAMAIDIENDPRLNPFLKNEELRRFSLETGLWEGAARDENIHLVKLAESFTRDFNIKEIDKSLKKLSELQLPDGSWPWFKGMRPDFRMTLHIIGGIGELREMSVEKNIPGSTIERMIEGALNSVDRTMFERYNRFKINHPDDEAPLTSDLLFYLYVRSYFQDIELKDKYQEAWSHYFELSGKSWLNWSISQQSFIAMAHLRYGEDRIPELIFNSLLDRRILYKDGGIFWKANPQIRGWYERDIWQQSRLIEFFNLMPAGQQYLDDMKTYLIIQKRSRDWSDRISTGLAVKSLILYGSEWYSKKPEVKISSPAEYFSPLRINMGTDKSGHYRYSWEEQAINEGDAELKIQNTGNTPVWGSLYEMKTIDIDTLSSSGSDLKVSRILLVQRDKGGNMKWEPLNSEDIRAGQRVKVRLEVEAVQAVDYVQLRDYKSASFEPDKSLSGYRWDNGISWYQIQADQYIDFFIHHLPKGYSFFEYDLYAEQTGVFNRGYAEIQSQYAPEFLGRSASGSVIIR